MDNIPLPVNRLVSDNCEDCSGKVVWVSGLVRYYDVAENIPLFSVLPQGQRVVRIGAPAARIVGVMAE